MDVIAEIRRRFGGHPDLQLVESSGSIEARPVRENGFPVALFQEPDGYLVHFSGWHEHFGSPREALHCFCYGLMGDCRLRITYRGATAHRWTLEEHRDGRWLEESTTGLFFFPFWRRSRTSILQNRIPAAPRGGPSSGPHDLTSSS